MNFNKLRKNDVVYSESKGSKVFKLLSYGNNSWLVEDIFTKKKETLNEFDLFKVVKTEKSSKKISMVNLLENEQINTQSTLTDNEVFIVNELKDSYDEEYLHDIIHSYEDGELNVANKIVSNLLKVVNLTSLATTEQRLLIQYIYCAIENYDKDISTSTKIKRFGRFYVSAIEISDVRQFQEWTLNIPALDVDMATKISENVMPTFFQYDPDAQDMDYGDTDFIAWGEIEVHKEQERFDKQLVL